jgi:excinuclease ABC subunit C
MFSSALDEIDGLGEKRKLALLKHFGSVEAIAAANVSEIAAVNGMNSKVAENVKAALDKVTVVESDEGTDSQ